VFSAESEPKRNAESRDVYGHRWATVMTKAIREAQMRSVSAVAEGQLPVRAG
jgi:hypothetical protein